jgi:hypothetical protein
VCVHVGNQWSRGVVIARLQSFCSEPFSSTSRSPPIDLPILLGRSGTNPSSPTMPWTFISMDFVEGLPKSGSKNVILVVVDRLTKYAHFILLSHPYTATTVTQLFIDNVFKLHGPLVAIITGRDIIFTSQLWQHIFESMKVALHYNSAYHPQSDGQTDKVNQCLENYLRCMDFLEPKKWLSWLSLAEWWYNSNYHTSLKCTPFEALYGYPPPLIYEVMIPGPDSSALDFLKQKGHMIIKLRENLNQAQQAIKNMLIRKEVKEYLQ